MSTRAHVAPLRSPRLSEHVPSWIATLGLGWNAFGIVQFLSSVRQTPESLAQAGLTPDQVAVLSSTPAWMTVAFALGVFGGLVGSVLLFARRHLAVPVFGVSLLGYVVLFVGDVTEGIFAVLGAPQVAVLTTVVAIAVGLFTYARRLAIAGRLR
ncbi:MAG: hypothetical protein R3B99_35310 [Polyangiales bacterium]